MSPKNKRRKLRKKRGGHFERDDDVENAENVQSLPEVNEDIPKTSKTLYLDLIERAARQLNSESDNQLRVLLDSLFTTIVNFSTETEKNLAIKITEDLCSNLLPKYDVDELRRLKRKLHAQILPKQLRQLIVKEDALRSDFFLSIMGVGHFGILMKGSLKTADGTNITVVIKESADTCHDQMILSEAKILSQLNHKNIIQILAFQNSGPRFAVEYMSLGNLRDALEKYTFTDAKLISILVEVTSGLEYIAKNDYIHRDVRSKNIMLNSNGDCKISEFGLCRYVGDTRGIYIEKEMNIEGYYIAPESRKTNTFTTKSDVWAIGLLAWEIYFVCRAFSDGGPTTVSKQSLKLGYLRTLVSTGRLPKFSFPSSLWSYFERFVLNKNPEKRPSFSKIKEKLSAYNMENKV